MTRGPDKTGRLVVVSNRVADDRPPAGGLVFALHDCLTREGGIWIGSADNTKPAPGEALAQKKGSTYDRYLFDMTEEEHAQFYLGYSNSVLWPLCHGRTDLMDIKPGNYEGYRVVNARLAQQMVAVLKPDDMIWVHDYHFLPLAHELRARGATNRIGFFLHIPFPAGHDLTAISEWMDVLEWLAAFDLVGAVFDHLHLDRHHCGWFGLCNGCFGAAIHQIMWQGEDHIPRAGNLHLFKGLRCLFAHPVQRVQPGKQAKESFGPPRHYPASPIRANQSYSLSVSMPNSAAFFALDPAPGPVTT